MPFNLLIFHELYRFCCDVKIQPRGWGQGLNSGCLVLAGLQEELGLQARDEARCFQFRFQ